MSGKQVLRESVLADRRAIPPAEREAADRALAEAAVLLCAGHQRVAAYVPMIGEPGGQWLVPALAAVTELLLPVHRPDNDLDWAVYTETLGPGTSITRLREPTGPRLGVTAIATATLVLVPALAVDGTGMRLGRGGGSYDRALARVPTGVPIVALLYVDEMLPAVPSDPHDRPVTAALRPTGLTQLP